MIISAFLYMLLFCIAVGLLYNEQLWENFKASIITDWIFFAITLVFATLLLILISLHIYLFSKNLTTFQFIMIRRAEEQLKQNEN